MIQNELKQKMNIINILNKMVMDRISQFKQYEIPILRNEHYISRIFAENYDYKKEYFKYINVTYINAHKRYAKILLNNFNYNYCLGIIMALNVNILISKPVRAQTTQLYPKIMIVARDYTWLLYHNVKLNKNGNGNAYK